MSGREILLDTHVWIWLVDGNRRELGRRARAALSKGSIAGSLLVSILSVWEVAMLEAKGRLGLSREIGEWIDAALAAPGVTLVGLDPATAIESARLPAWTDGDPVDRLLVATARLRGARLATRDRRLLEYGRSGSVDVVDAAS